MYLEFFGMSESPFPTVALSENYFGFHSMQQSLDLITSAIDRDAGPCLVIGGAGSGKTILLDVLKKQQENQHLAISLSSTRLCTRRSLLQNLIYELGLEYESRDEGELRLLLDRFLRTAPETSNGLVLLVDEAHTLPLHLLDELRVLTNHVRDGHSQVRLVLAGAAKLEENLSDPSMESFNQRIACRVYLTRIGRDELIHYIHYQLERVESSTRDLFTSEAVEAIHIATDGIPRLVNQLCEFALVCAAEKRVKQIDEPLIQWAWSIMQQIPCATVPEPPRSSEESSSPTQQDIIEFGELDDEGPTSQSVPAPGAETLLEAEPEIESIQTPEIAPPSESAEVPAPPEPAVSNVRPQSEDSPAVITFAFEQDIQRPIRQTDEQIDSVTERVADQSKRELAAANQPLKVESEDAYHLADAPRPPQVDTHAIERRFQSTLDTISHALNSLDQDWDTVEQVLAEAELSQISRPVSSDPQRNFPILAGQVKKTPRVESQHGDLFGDHLYDEIEKVQDTDWAQFLQPLDEANGEQDSRSMVFDSAIAADPKAESSESIGKSQPGVDPVNSSKTPPAAVSFPVDDDDRRIIHAVEHQEIVARHDSHPQMPSPAARRKDLRALLTALRGY